MNRRSGARSRLLVATVLGVLVLPLVPAAVFAGSLDQSQEDTSGGTQKVCGPESDYLAACPLVEAQTFTAGATGLLDEVQLHVVRTEGSDPLYIWISDTEASGSPGTQVLAVGTISDAGAAGWHTVQFENVTTVVAGTRYAIVASTANDTLWEWSFDYDASDNPYDGGSRYSAEGSPSSAWALSADADNAFRTYVEPINDLEVSMVGPSSIRKGSTFTYLVTVSNDGDVAAADVLLTDNLPFGVQYVTATTTAGSCTAATKKVRTVTCDIGSIPANGSVTVAITVKAAARAGSFVNNIVTVSGSTFDPDGSNNSASLSTAITR